MSFALSTTSIVVDNKNSRIKFNGGGSTKHLDEGVSNDYYRSSAFVFDKSSTGTFKFTGPWVKVHGKKQFQYNSPTGTVKCSIKPNDGSAIPAQTEDGGGSSFDTLCGFKNLPPSKSYTLIISGTKGATIDYVEYGSQNPKDSDVVRYYPQNTNFKFTNTNFARGYAVMGVNSSLNFTYTGASTVTAYASRPDFDYPAVFNLTYDFAQTRRFDVPSQTVGNYLPLQLTSSTHVKYGSHWMSFKPINNDKPLFLDFIEVPYKAKTNARALPEPEPMALTTASSGVHGVCDDVVKAVLFVLVLLGMMDGTFPAVVTRRDKSSWSNKVLLLKLDWI